MTIESDLSMDAYHQNGTWKTVTFLIIFFYKEIAEIMCTFFWIITTFKRCIKASLPSMDGQHEVCICVWFCALYGNGWVDSFNDDAHEWYWVSE